MRGLHRFRSPAHLPNTQQPPHFWQWQRENLELTGTWRPLRDHPGSEVGFRDKRPPAPVTDWPSRRKASWRLAMVTQMGWCAMGRGACTLRLAACYRLAATLRGWTRTPSLIRKGGVAQERHRPDCCLMNLLTLLAVVLLPADNQQNCTNKSADQCGCRP